MGQIHIKLPFEQNNEKKNFFFDILSPSSFPLPPGPQTRFLNTKPDNSPHRPSFNVRSVRFNFFHSFSGHFSSSGQNGRDTGRSIYSTTTGAHRGYHLPLPLPLPSPGVQTPRLDINLGAHMEKSPYRRRA